MALKTRAISKYNVAVNEQSGKVGNVRYFQKGGQTYVRAAHNSAHTNNRTDAQMEQRLKFASLSALYSHFAAIGALRGAFTRKEQNQSDFNAFIKVNQGRGIYMTREQKAAGCAVSFPIQISQGSLGVVTTTYKAEGNVVKSDIQVGDITGDYTIGLISRAIIAKNRGYRNGDRIVAIAVSQDGDLTTPFVSVTFTKLILDTRSDTLLNTTEFSVVDGTLAIADIDFSCCIGFVHTSDRKVSDCTLLSVNSEFIEHFTSEEQWQEARNSYGTPTGEILFNDEQGSIYDNVAGED